MVPKYVPVVIIIALIAVGLTVFVTLSIHSPNVANNTISQTSSTRSTGPGYLLLSLPQPYGPKFVAADVNNAFTLVLVDVGNLSGTASLTATGSPGLSVSFNPAFFVLTGSDAAFALTVNASRELIPGTYDKTLVVTTQSGRFTETFQFTVVPYLIVIRQGAYPDPVNLTVKSGGTVIWYNADAGTEDSTDVHMLVFTGMGVDSPVLHRFDFWSHTFSGLGVYEYQDSLNIYFPRAQIVVSG